MAVKPAKVIFGLGNPGRQFEATRHNVGFCVVDRLCTKYDGAFTTSKHLHADTVKITIGSETALLIKPSTYMNLAGVSVVATMAWFKLALTDLLVIHDDVSLPLGRIRFQKQGGAGGQHGVESIIESLGLAEFNRLKIGVGPDPGGELRANYVLSTFSARETPVLELMLKVATAATEMWIKKGIETAMNKFNGMDLTFLVGKDQASLQNVESVLDQFLNGASLDVLAELKASIER